MKVSDCDVVVTDDKGKHIPCSTKANKKITMSIIHLPESKPTEYQDPIPTEPIRIGRKSSPYREVG